MDFGTLANEHGVGLALAVIVVVQVISLVYRLAPNALTGWQQSREKARQHKESVEVEQLKHQHEIEIEKLKHGHLQQLGSQEKVFDVIKDHQDFLENTITLALEVQAFRGTITARLDSIEEDIAGLRQELRNQRQQSPGYDKKDDTHGAAT